MYRDSVKMVIDLLVMERGSYTKGQWKKIHFYYKGTVARDFCFILHKIPKCANLASLKFVRRWKLPFYESLVNFGRSPFLKYTFSSRFQYFYHCKGRIRIYVEKIIIGPDLVWDLIAWIDIDIQQQKKCIF